MIVLFHLGDMEQKPSRKNKLKLSFIFLALLILGASAVFWGVKKLPKKTEIPKEETKTEFFVLQQTPVQDELEFYGSLEANKESQLAAKTGGRVASLKVNQGDMVKRGQLLAYLHPDQNAIDLANRIRNLNNFESYQDENESYWDKQVSIAKRSLELAKEEEDYTKKHEPEKEEIAEEKVDLAKAELESTKRGRDAQYENLNMQSGELSGYVDISRQNVTDTKIFAPFNGIVSDKFLEEGTVVGAGQTLLSVADVSSYKVVIEVPDSEIEKISLGLKAKVVLDGFEGEQSATIALIRPKADAAAKKTEVELVLESAVQNVKLNNFARVYIKFPQRDAFSVPTNYIISGYEGPFVILDNGTQQLVQRGGENNGKTEIAFDGIAEGIIIKRK